MKRKDNVSATYELNVRWLKSQEHIFQSALAHRRTLDILYQQIITSQDYENSTDLKRKAEQLAESITRAEVVFLSVQRELKLVKELIKT